MLVLSPVGVLVAVAPLRRMARRRNHDPQSMTAALVTVGILLGVVAGLGIVFGLALGSASRRMTAFTLVVVGVALLVVVPAWWRYSRPAAPPLVVPPYPPVAQRGDPSARELPPPDPHDRLG